MFRAVGGDRASTRHGLTVLLSQLLSQPPWPQPAGQETATATATASWPGQRHSHSHRQLARPEAQPQPQPEAAGQACHRAAACRHSCSRDGRRSADWVISAVKSWGAPAARHKVTPWPGCSSTRRWRRRRKWASNLTLLGRWTSLS